MAMLRYFLWIDLLWRCSSGFLFFNAPDPSNFPNSITSHFAGMNQTIVIVTHPSRAQIDLQMRLWALAP